MSHMYTPAKFSRSKNQQHKRFNNGELLCKPLLPVRSFLLADHNTACFYKRDDIVTDFQSKIIDGIYRDS